VVLVLASLSVLVVEIEKCFARSVCSQDIRLSIYTELGYVLVFGFGDFAQRHQEWNGYFFDKTSLRQLGLRKQLGHCIGERCLNPIPCRNNEFWITDSYGLHNVAIDFCGCGKDDQRHTVQLLRSRLYPATVVNPQSAATFDALKAFEILSYESKVSAFEFYHSQSRLTDNTGLNTPNVCAYL